MPTVDLDRAGETLAMARDTAGVTTSAFLYWDFKPRGAVWSSNALFKAALHMETPYIAYLNDDTVPDQQDWLKLMIRGLEEKEKYGFASPSGECSTNPQRSGKPGDPFAVHVVNKPLAWFVAVIKRECLQDVGLFWDQLIHYGDESDWIQRAFRQGWKQIWTQGVYIRHNKQGGGELKEKRNIWAKHDKRLYRKRWVGKKKTQATKTGKTKDIPRMNLLPNAQFGAIIGTGRTGSHWFDMLFRKWGRPKIASFHDGLPKRLKYRTNASKMVANYLLNLEAKQPGAQIYVECNPALIEWIGLDHDVSATEVLPAGTLAKPPNYALLVRHPFGYVKSLRAKGWGWSWWKKPGFQMKGYAQMSELEKTCAAWTWKNAYAYDLVSGDPDRVFRFEDIFNGGVAEVRRLARALDIGIGASNASIGKLLTQRAAAKGGYQLTLTTNEKSRIKELCAPVMELFDYA
jgi:hypothetical protein